MIWLFLEKVIVLFDCHGRDRMVIKLCDKVCQWLAFRGQWFSPGTPVSSTNKHDLHNITEILLKVVLNTINQTKPIKKCTSYNWYWISSKLYMLAYYNVRIYISLISDNALKEFLPFLTENLFKIIWCDWGHLFQVKKN